MHTVQIDISDDQLETFLTIIKNLRQDMITGVKIKSDTLDIEPVEKESQDFIDIQIAKSENNPKYSIEEAKQKLGL